MENGDEAVTEGMDKVLGTADRRLGFDEINKTRDYIAQKFKAVRDAVRSIAAGGTGASTASGARANLAVPETAVAGLKFTSPGFGRLSYQAPGVAFPTEIAIAGSYASQASLDSVKAGLDSVRAGVMSPDIYNRGTSGSWRSLAVQADGILAQTASARRFKENIEPLDVTDEQLNELALVAFDWIADGTPDVGVIADDVEHVLPWAVFHDENGIILGVHYDRIALAFLPVMQRLLARVTDLEAVIRDASATE